MTHQATGQWDREYPGHLGKQDWLLGAYAGTHCAGAPRTALEAAVVMVPVSQCPGGSRPGSTQTHFVPAEPVRPVPQKWPQSLWGTGFES